MSVQIFTRINHFFFPLDLRDTSPAEGPSRPPYSFSSQALACPSFLTPWMKPWCSGGTLHCENLIRTLMNTVQNCAILCISRDNPPMHGAAHMPLSPAAAAKIANVSRSLISREIKSGALPATLKNNGHHAVAEADLREWMSRRTDRATAPDPVPAATAADRPVDASHIEVIAQELATTKEALARLEGQQEATAARLVDLAADRDAWRDQAQRLASEARTIVVPGIWSRIFGTR